MFVFKAAVVGAGVMGGEIAQVIAAADIPVVLKDVDRRLVDAGLAKAREVASGQAAKLMVKGKLTQEQSDAQVRRILANITGTTEYDGFGDVDFVIEAVPEKLEIKHQVFADLDAVTPGHAILASNTSGLSITEIADATLRPDKGVGDLALSGRERSSGGSDRRAHPRARADADGAVPPRRHVGSGHRREGRPRHARALRRPLLRPQGDGGAARARRPRRQDREGLLWAPLSPTRGSTSGSPTASP